MKTRSPWFWFFAALVLISVTPAIRALDAPQDNWHTYPHLKWSLPAAPQAITVEPDGSVYVALSTGVIQVYTSTGTPVRQFGDPDDLGSVTGMEMNPNGDLFVLTTNSTKVVVYNSTGTKLRSWGGQGSGNGLFGYTETDTGHDKIALDSVGNVYVVDFPNGLVQKFTADGVFLLQWGGKENVVGQFGDGPSSIGVLANDLVAVVNAVRYHTLQIFTANGELERAPLFSDDIVGHPHYTSLTVLPDNLLAYFTLEFGVRLCDENLAFLPEEKFYGPYTRVVAVDARGRIHAGLDAGGRREVVIYERSYLIENPSVYNSLPQPVILNSEQRSSTPYVDFDYKVVDVDDASVEVGILGFLDGGNDLSKILKMSTFVEETANHIGPNQPTNQVRRLTWNAAADWSTDFGDIQFEILAKDSRGLMPFHWITIPAQDEQPALQVSHRPVTDTELLDLWYWLIARNDPDIDLVNGTILGTATSGLYNGEILSTSSTGTTAYGRTFLYEKLGVHPISISEMNRVASGQFGISSATELTVVKNSGSLSFNGVLAAWGDNGFGQSTITVLRAGYTAVATGVSHSLALSDGIVESWGDSTYGPVPAGLSGVVAIAAGYNHNLALKNDGTVVAWGNNNYGQLDVPANLTGVTAIAAGAGHSLALKNDGSIVAWGRNDFGQCTTPVNLTGVTAIAAGVWHTVALQDDGAIAVWGGNYYGQCNVPADLTGVTAIAAGGVHTVVLKSNGTVTAWGDISPSSPAGLTDVVAISAGFEHCLALKNDGTVIAWGESDDTDVLNVPTNLTGVTKLATGPASSHALVIRNLAP